MLKYFKIVLRNDKLLPQKKSESVPIHEGTIGIRHSVLISSHLWRNSVKMQKEWTKQQINHQNIKKYVFTEGGGRATESLLTMMGHSCFYFTRCFVQTDLKVK